jgi:16S rRNA (cytosine967-C5)-methyltransferase
MGKTIAAASLEALLAVDAGQHADRALNEVGRRFRLQSSDRLAVKLWLYRTLRWRGRFDAVLRKAAGPWTDPLCGNAARLALSSGFECANDPVLLAGLSHTLEERGYRQASRQLQSLTRSGTQLPLPEASDPLAALAETYSHPQWMVELFATQFPEDFQKVLAANNAEPPVTLRTNVLKTDRDTLRAKLQAEGVDTTLGAYSPYALHVVSHKDVFRTSAFREGLFEMQDEGSQLLGWVLDPKPRGLIIDACAGAGGKTLLLAGMLRNRARILSVDIFENKLTRLRERARRAGVSNMDTRLMEAGGISEDLVGKAESVLVDAPCTGLGALRRNPDAKWRVEAADVEELSARQLGILRLWSEAVKPGGLLVYSTCTVTEAENQGVIEKFLAKSPQFVLEPACTRFVSDAERFQTPEGYFTCLPHRDQTDGFFAARMRRKS